MIPKTAIEKRIVALSNGLPNIGKRQYNRAFENSFDKYFVQSRKTIFCLECGHSWKLTTDKQLTKTTCKKCRKTLVTADDYKNGMNVVQYSQIVTVVEDFQLVRVLCHKKYLKKNEEAIHFGHEVMQIFIDGNGEYRYLSKNVMGMSQYYDQWIVSSNLSIKPKGESRRFHLTPNHVEFDGKTLPIFERNGFKGEFYHIAPQVLFTDLIHNNLAETLIKCNQFSLLNYHCQRKYFTEKDSYWNSIKICLRNNYIVEDASDWMNYIDLLVYFKKDIRNAKYVCPENFRRAHDKLVSKKNAILRKEKIAKLRKAIAEEQKRYIKSKKQFFGLEFSNKNISIKVLRNVKEFFEEGLVHGHCVFANEYFKKDECLVLSATVDNVRTETIEVDLNKLRIVQSRGKGNKATPYNRQIVNLVSKNLHQIGARMKTAS